MLTKTTRSFQFKYALGIHLIEAAARGFQVELSKSPTHSSGEYHVLLKLGPDNILDIYGDVDSLIRQLDVFFVEISEGNFDKSPH